MFNIFNVAKRVIQEYLATLGKYHAREEKNSRKQLDSFILNSCILINTVDHIRETISNITDLVITLVDNNFSEKIEFGHEEELILRLINGIVDSLKRLIDQPVEQCIGNFISRANWDLKDSAILDSSAYIRDVRAQVSGVVDLMRGNVASIYFAKVLNSFCKIINDHFVNAVFKIKKFSSQGIQQLILDFNELKSIMQALGVDQDGEPVSKLFTIFIDKISKRTVSIIKLLGMDNTQLIKHFQSFKGVVSTSEIERILAFKGFQRSQIEELTKNF